MRPAIILPPTHIAALLDFAAMEEAEISVNGDTINATNPEHLRALGQLLVDQNFRAAGFNNPPVYSHRSHQRSFTAVEIIKACNAYDMTCDTDDYIDTLPAMVVDSIRRAAINYLPGYKDAPWVIATTNKETQQ